MLFLILGIALGTATALGAIPFFSHVVLLASSDSLSIATHLSSLVMARLITHDRHLAQVLTILIGVAIPGLVSLVLMVAAKLGTKVRRAVAPLVVLASLASFMLLPFSQAMFMVGLSVVVGLIFFFVSGALIVAPLAAISAAMAVSSFRSLLEGSSPTIHAATLAMSQISHFDSPIFWKLVMLVVASAGFVGAFLTAFHPVRAD